jgi:hypothetical protein
MLPSRVGESVVVQICSKILAMRFLISARSNVVSDAHQAAVPAGTRMLPSRVGESVVAQTCSKTRDASPISTHRTLSVIPTGPLSHVGRVCFRAWVGESVAVQTCSKILAMRPEAAPTASGQVTPTGPLSRVGRVDARASIGGSGFNAICSKIFAMRSASIVRRASGASPSGSGAPYTQ